MKMKSYIVFLMVALLPGALCAQVSIMMTSFYDESRDRSIGADVFYPAINPGVNMPLRGGPYPVVVFGHGMAMPVQSYRHFVTIFNSEGYIVVLPKTEMGMSPEHENFSKDMAFMTEAIVAEASTPGSPIYGGVEPRFAAVGHSMGGGAAFWSATLTDRFETIVAMAPAEFQPKPSIAAASIDLPVLIITGTNDGVTSLPGHILPIYNALNTSCKSLVSIKGGSHCGFSNPNWLCNLGENILAPSDFVGKDVQHKVTYDYMLPWLRYYLKDECARLDELNISGMEDERVEFINDCEVFTDPCIEVTEDFLFLETPASSYSWKLNGELLVGEDVATLSTGYGSGVYECTAVLGNGCMVFSDPFWYFGDFTETRGDLRFRVYQHPSSDEVILELFGMKLPLDFYLFNASGDRLLHSEVTRNRQQMTLPIDNSGLLFFSLQTMGKTVGRGKLMYH